MISEGYSKQLTSHNACELRPSCCAWFAMQARSWKFESHFSEDLPLWEAVMFVAHCMLLLMKQWQNKAKRKSTRLWSFCEDDITEGQKGFQNYHLQGLPLPGLKDCWRSSSNPLIVAAWLGQVTPAPGLQDFFGALTCDIQAKWVFDETEIQIRFFNGVLQHLRGPHLSFLSKLLCLTQWCHHKWLHLRVSLGLPRSRFHHIFIRESSSFKPIKKDLSLHVTW